jgi:hypothetical protein
MWVIESFTDRLRIVNYRRDIFRHNGADRRLTGVHGHVIRDILA